MLPPEVEMKRQRVETADVNVQTEERGWADFEVEEVESQEGGYKIFKFAGGFTKQ